MDLDSNSSGKDIEEETNVCISPCCQNRCPKDKRAPLNPVLINWSFDFELFRRKFRLFDDKQPIDLFFYAFYSMNHRL